MNHNHTIEPLTVEAKLQQRTMWKWAGAVTVMCLIPLSAMLMGADFSSHHTPLNADMVADMTITELGDAAHHALRGSFTHTLLEWTAFCAAVFVVVLAFVHFWLTREPSLPIIGMARNAVN